MDNDRLAGNFYRLLFSRVRLLDKGQALEEDIYDFNNDFVFRINDNFNYS